MAKKYDGEQMAITDKGSLGVYLFLKEPLLRNRFQNKNKMMM